MVMMYPDVEGNFISKCRVETTTPRMFSDRRPNRTLYEVLTLMTRYLTSMVQVNLPFLKVLCGTKYPMAETFSLKKSYNYSS